MLCNLSTTDQRERIGINNTIYSIYCLKLIEKLAARSKKPILNLNRSVYENTGDQSAERPQLLECASPETDPDEAGPGRNGTTAYEYHCGFQGTIGKNVSHDDRAPLQ